MFKDRRSIPQWAISTTNPRDSVPRASRRLKGQGVKKREMELRLKSLGHVGLEGQEKRECYSPFKLKAYPEFFSVWVVRGSLASVLWAPAYRKSGFVLWLRRRSTMQHWYESAWHSLQSSIARFPLPPRSFLLYGWDERVEAISGCL